MGVAPISRYWTPLRQECVAPVSTNAAGDVIPIFTGIRAPLYSTESDVVYIHLLYGWFSLPCSCPFWLSLFWINIVIVLGVYVTKVFGFGIGGEVRQILQLILCVWFLIFRLDFPHGCTHVWICLDDWFRLLLHCCLGLGHCLCGTMGTRPSSVPVSHYWDPS